MRVPRRGSHPRGWTHVHRKLARLLLDVLRGVPKGFLSLFRLFAAAVGQEGAVSGAGRVTSLTGGARAPLAAIRQLR